MYKTLAILLIVAAVAYSQDLSCVTVGATCDPAAPIQNFAGISNPTACCQECDKVAGCAGWGIGPDNGCVLMASCTPVPSTSDRQIGARGCGCN